MGYYIYRRHRALLTRSAFRRLADGEIFFYALLLEKGHWRQEEELIGDSASYRARFHQLFP
jgi:hypothetical protein